MTDERATKMAGVAAKREELTAAQLQQPRAHGVLPIDNKFFAPPLQSERYPRPKLRFVGSLTLPGHPMQTIPHAIVPAQIGEKHTQRFPRVTVRWVSYPDGYLVPVERGRLVCDEEDLSYWQFHPERGRVWEEPADGGLCRAAFPFILTSRIENESYYGLSTFLYGSGGQVSALRYQVVQQLANFLVRTRFVVAGQIRVACDASLTLHDTPAFRARLDRELAEELPWRDWSDLKQQVGDEVLAEVDSGGDPSAIVASGMVVDGVVYTRAFPTPFGTYPFPRQMRHGVWSCGKSLIGLVMAARLGQIYGPEILDFKIRDLVNVTAEHDGWDHVTLRHTLSMATGMFLSFSGLFLV